MRLHPEVQGRIADIERIEVTTHESAIRIISKVGPLANPADRDHCLQYMIAVPLLYGNLVAEHYEDSFQQGEPRIDELREQHPRHGLPRRRWRLVLIHLRSLPGGRGRSTGS